MDEDLYQRIWPDLERLARQAMNVRRAVEEIGRGSEDATRATLIEVKCELEETADVADRALSKVLEHLPAKQPIRPAHPAQELGGLRVDGSGD
jgi:hypothetical protein